MARLPLIDAAGNFLSAQVRASIDARAQARMDAAKVVTEARLPVLAEELGIGTTGVPIFPTLAEAEAWEAKNPGKMALTIETVTPDTTAPTWPAGTAVSISKTDTTAILTLTQLATDDKGVTSYELSTDGGTTWRVVVLDAAKSVTVTGLTATTAYPAPKFRAKDAAGNVSTVLTASAGFTTDAAPPVPYTATALALKPLHYYPGPTVTNQGTYGTSGVQFNATGSTDGTSLAGFPASYHLDPGEKFDIQTSAGLLGATKWAWAAVLRINSIIYLEQSDNDYIIWAQMNGAANGSIRLSSESPINNVVGDAPTGLEVAGVRVRDFGAAPQVIAVGAEYDGTTVTGYLNGKAVSTGKASNALSASSVWNGIGTKGAMSRITSSVDWVGYILHNNTLGAAAFEQLAKDAGVYTA